MAFVSQENKKELAVGIKAVLKKYKMKGSISVKHHSTLVVKLKSGEIDLIGAYNENAVKRAIKEVQYNPDHICNLEYCLSRAYFDVNTHWIEEHYEGVVRDFLVELKDAMLGENYFDESDAMTDYFHCSHYIDIEVGTYEKDYQCTAKDYVEFDKKAAIKNVLQYVEAAA